MAYLAYRLGCLPYVLLGSPDHAFRIEWDHSRPLFDWAVAEGLGAIDALRVAGAEDRSKADLAHEAVTAWGNLIRSRLPEVERPYHDQGSAAKTREELLFVEEYRDPKWADFAALVRDFWKTLAKPYRDLAGLGDEVGNVITWRLRFATIDTDLETFTSMTVRLQGETCLIVETQELLVGLDLDLAPQESHRVATEYCFWAQDQVRLLHRAVIERLGPRNASATFAPVWISASDAIKVANALGLPLLLSTLNKHAKTHPVPFLSRSAEGKKAEVGPRTKRIVEVNSFVAWVQRERGSRHEENEPLEGDEGLEDRKEKERQRKKKLRGSGEP
jgi:hypothetical protein